MVVSDCFDGLLVLTAQNWPTTVNIVDTVRVPADTVPGEYVLSWVRLSRGHLQSSSGFMIGRKDLA